MSSYLTRTLRQGSRRFTPGGLRIIRLVQESIFPILTGRMVIPTAGARIKMARRNADSAV